MEGEHEGEPAAAPRGKSKSARSVGLPADWQPRVEEREAATGSQLDCDREASHFRDHHTAKASRFADWDAAFRTWLRNAVNFGRKGANGKSQTPLDAQLERIKMLEREELAQLELAESGT